MNKFYTRTVEPTSEPVATADARAFLRADASEDTAIAGLVTVAREVVENFTGRALMPQTWKMVADSWPCGNRMDWRTIKLERTPVATVTSVKYWPAVGSVQQTLSTSLYTVLAGSEPGKIFLNYGEVWPDLAERPDAIEVIFTAGHADAAHVPATLKHAVSLLTSNFYDQRAPINVGNIVNELPMNLKHILESQRVGGFVA